jgi:hypothetical protein
LDGAAVDEPVQRLAQLGHAAPRSLVEDDGVGDVVLALQGNGADAPLLAAVRAAAPVGAAGLADVAAA